MNDEYDPYRELAQAVIQFAIDELSGVRLTKLDCRISAGRFLLDRRDQVALTWFRGAGFDVDVVRGTAAARTWRLKLAGLELLQTQLREKRVQEAGEFWARRMEKRNEDMRRWRKNEKIKRAQVRAEGA